MVQMSTTGSLFMHRQSGFTLIELMIVIVLVAIFSSIAIPAYQEMIRSGRITQTTNGLLGFLQLARSEAVTGRAEIIVCASGDQATCSSGATWQQGAVMLRGANLIKALPAAGSGVTIGSGSTSLTYRTDGTLAAAAAFRICDSRGAGNSRQVSVTIIGQATSGANATCP